MNDSLKSWIAIAVLLLAAVGFGIWWWNQGYGEVSSQGYSYAMALFSACNQKDAEKVAEIADMIEADQKENKLSADEAGWLAGVIAKAEAGNWSAANRQIRQLMEDQIETRNPLPDLD